MTRKFAQAFYLWISGVTFGVGITVCLSDGWASGAFAVLAGVITSCDALAKKGDE